MKARTRIVYGVAIQLDCAEAKPRLSHEASVVIVVVVVVVVVS
ncbi:hypothetical protein RF55_6185, partial [Lasius niger]